MRAIQITKPRLDNQRRYHYSLQRLDGVDGAACQRWFISEPDVPGFGRGSPQVTLFVGIANENELVERKTNSAPIYGTIEMSIACKLRRARSSSSRANWALNLLSRAVNVVS